MAGLTLQAQPCEQLERALTARGWKTLDGSLGDCREILSQKSRAAPCRKGMGRKRRARAGSGPVPGAPGPRAARRCWELCSVPASSALAGSQGGFTRSTVPAQGHGLRGAVKTGCLHSWGNWECAMNSL